jgi:hypothetical protein
MVIETKNVISGLFSRCGMAEKNVVLEDMSIETLKKN